MTTSEFPERLRAKPSVPYWLVLCLLGAAVAFFLWKDHEAHILRALPWLVVLACPLLHLLMHRRHGESQHQDQHER